MNMKMERYIRAIAGSFVLLSMLMAYLHSAYWLFFTTFVGLNLLQSAFTKWCPMEILLGKLGVPRDNG
jgi:glucan phosphoethanolaminetransferase (alkaline phosphatase superfamily)